MTQQGEVPIVPAGPAIFPRITWMREAADDPRLRPCERDLAVAMGYSADKHGRCDATVAQLARRMVTRAADGAYVPERTLKEWRRKLKRLGYMVDVDPGRMGSAHRLGRGQGGLWQLLESGQDRPSEAGKEAGKELAPSTSTPTSGSSRPRDERGEVEGDPTLESADALPTLGDLLIATGELPHVATNERVAPESAAPAGDGAAMGGVRRRLHLIEIDLGPDRSLPWAIPSFVEGDADAPNERRALEQARPPVSAERWRYDVLTGRWQP